MSQKYVIGMDFGSDSIRAILVDAADGRELASTVTNYPRWARGMYSDAAENRFRHHPKDYIEAMTASLKGVIAECPDKSAITAIAMDSTGSTPCFATKELVPLALTPGFEEDPDAMFVLWKDHTGEKEAGEITALCAKSPVNYACHSGNAYSAECFWSKVLHILRKSQKVRAAAETVVELCDWIPILLTGARSVPEERMGHCVAGAKLMWAEEWGGFPPEKFFRELDPVLVKVRNSLPQKNYYCDEAAGHLCPEWAGILGLSENVVIGVGNIDSHSGAIGAGVANKQMVMNFGTSACYMCVVPNEEMGGRIVDGVFGQVDGMILRGMDGFEAGLSTFGDAFAWFRRLLSWPLEQFITDPEQKKAMEDAILAKLTVEAEKLPQRLDAPVATDYFNGRRCPHLNGSITAAITGLKLASSAPEIFYSIVEAVAFATKAIIDHLASYGITFEHLVAVGGVSQKSPFTMQMISDVLGLPIEVSDSRHSGALGSAIHAAVAAGLYPDVPAAQKAMCPPLLRVHTPNPEKKPLYDARYRKYKSIVNYTETEQKINY